MALSRDLFTYADVRQVLEAALNVNGAVYTLPSPSAAMRWRQRAYYYRKLLREHLSEQAGYPCETPFDMMRLTIPKGSSAVEINFTPLTPGVLTTPDGKPIALAGPEEDKLAVEAAQFLETLRK